MDYRCPREVGPTPYCQVCGSETPDGASFCPTCGARLEPLSSETAESAGRAKRRSAEPTDSGVHIAPTSEGRHEAREPSSGHHEPVAQEEAESDDQKAPSTTPTFLRVGPRYLLGFGQSHYGIWDRHFPGPPVERFPPTEEGLDAARKRYQLLSQSAQATATWNSGRQGSLPAITARGAIVGLAVALAIGGLVVWQTRSPGEGAGVISRCQHIQNAWEGLALAGQVDREMGRQLGVQQVLSPASIPYWREEAKWYRYVADELAGVSTSLSARARRVANYLYQAVRYGGSSSVYLLNDVSAAARLLPIPLHSLGPRPHGTHCRT